MIVVVVVVYNNDDNNNNNNNIGIICVVVAAPTDVNAMSVVVLIYEFSFDFTMKNPMKELNERIQYID